MKQVVPAGVFLIACAAAYFLLSFCVPGWQIKLEAEPFVVFLETLKILWPVKALISLAMGGILGLISHILLKQR